MNKNKLKLSPSLLDSIGNTPLIDVSFFSPNPAVKIFAKLESANPSGSIKDRIAIAMIEKAEKEGKLKEGATIIEPTSGNTGISLAMVAAVKGYKFIAVMPKSMSKERRKMIKAFGGKLILVDEGESETIKTAEKLAKEKGYFMPNQFENEANVEVYYNIFSKEILSQISKISIFIAGIGTGGTLTGTSKRLKEISKKIKVIAFYSLDEKVQGTVNIEQFKPKILDLSNTDNLVPADEKLAIKTMEKLWENNIFVGMSSAAAMNIALEESKKMKEGNIVIIFADSGDRYLSLFKEKQ